MKKAIILSAFILLSCQGRIYRTVYPLLNDGKYDSEFPYKNCSQEIKAICDMTVKIYCTTHYKIYYFDRSDKMTRRDIQERGLLQCKSTSYSENPVAGSGLVISSTSQSVLVLTCSHVVYHSDSLFTYYNEEEKSRNRYIRTVAIKTRERLLAAGFPEDGVLQLLAHDPQVDLALIGRTWSKPLDRVINDFRYPLGKGVELDWGSFVYLIGYPQGQLMVTKAIVSQPNRDGRGGFLLDGNFNRGFSGGIILAIRDGVPNFEMVGLASSTSGAPEAVLTPSPDAEYGMRVPYDGQAYAVSINRINYGITFIVPSEAILEFINKQRTVFKGTAYEANLTQAFQQHRAPAVP
ncbi:MAG TPA: serine protease [bacterium]|nr:serine protease [bacterium]